MASLLLKLLCWCAPVLASEVGCGVSAPSGRWGVGCGEVPYTLHPTPYTQSPLPCLDSSAECIKQLAASAIAISPEIKVIDERVELIGKKIRKTRAGSVSDWVVLNPVGFAQNAIENLLGGGRVGNRRIAVATLEVRLSELQRRRGELEAQLRDEVLDLVLAYEKLERQLAGVRSQLAAHQQRVAILEASYRTGEGSTAQMIQLWQRTEDIEAKVRETEVSQSQTYRALLELTDYEDPNLP